MNKKEILKHFWLGASEKEGWYPPYADALQDVDAALADWRPEGVAANTIWETVVHVIYYKQRLLDRLQGKSDKPLETNDDTFFVASKDPSHWPETIAKLFEVHQQLYDALDKFDEEDFDRLQQKEPIGAQYLNLIVHDAYHTGQIIQVRKLKGAWPEKRSFV